MNSQSIRLNLILRCPFWRPEADVILFFDDNTANTDNITVSICTINDKLIQSTQLNQGNYVLDTHTRPLLIIQIFLLSLPLFGFIYKSCLKLNV